jgi:predicted DNA-binding antitoxin AbrB/MazE fold protein
LFIELKEFLWNYCVIFYCYLEINKEMKLMQACRAYYNNGRFVPFEPLEIPEGSQAIITVLDFPMVSIEGSPEDVSSRQKVAIARFREVVRNSEPLPPEFDEILCQRVNIKRELNL